MDPSREPLRRRNVLGSQYTSPSEYEKTGYTQRSSREGASARLSSLASTFIHGRTGSALRRWHSGEINLETPPTNLGTARVLCGD